MQQNLAQTVAKHTPTPTPTHKHIRMQMGKDYMTLFALLFPNDLILVHPTGLDDVKAITFGIWEADFLRIE